MTPRPDSSDGRIASMAHALHTDWAITLEQARAWYGFRLEHLEAHRVLDGLWRAERKVALSQRARSAEPVTFLCADGVVAALEGWQLRHLAGLAAARRRLRVTPDRWSLTALRSAVRDRAGRWAPDVIPDAEWRAPWGSVAVEYDAGSHRLESVAAKARAYGLNFDQQLWLAATADRCEALRRAVGSSLPDRTRWRVMRVDWR